MGQSMQTMHILTKPQGFYDESHKTTLGYQNPLYLSQDKRKIPTLYYGHTIVKKHDAMSVMDTKETLILAKESRLKMHVKQNDPIAKDNTVNIAPIDYVALNKLSEYYVKHFVPQKQLSAKQSFWLPISQPISEQPPVQPEPVITVHTKVTGQNESSWVFEHIQRAYERDVNPFVKTLKDYFHMFDKGLHKEITDMKEVFNQMEIEVAKYSVERKYFEIEKKELIIENDRLLEQIICQDVMCIAMHADFEHNYVLPANDNIDKYASMEKCYVEAYNQCLKLKAELVKKKDMIEKDVFIELSKRKKNSRMMLESIENGPLVYPNVKENGVIRPKKYAKLTEQEQLQDDCDVQATNIVLQGLPPDVYALSNHCQAAKDIWDRVKLLMQGTKLSYQERECKLYNDFYKFSSVKGESIHEYYLRFAQLINDIHTSDMTMQQVQVNTNFLNALQPEWSKFVTNVKLANNLYNTNYDQLYAYLSQHKGHANEVRMLREGYLDPLALVANHQTQSHSAQYPQQLSSTPQQTHSSQPYLSSYEAPHHPQQYQHPFQTQLNYTLPSIPQNLCDTPLISQQPQAEFPQLNSGLTVLTFRPCDDLIACLNKAMAFMSTVMASHFPSTNNELRTSSNLKNQSIKDGEGYMAGQCTQPKRPRNSAWFKEKMLLVQVQESGKVLDEGQLAFYADPRVADVQDTQTTITHNAAFQPDDLNAYNSECDDISSANAILMANLSSYCSDVLSG
ncbi:hypothetical protein Tco_0985606, partial [Tanacetum coccineum]